MTSKKLGGLFIPVFVIAALVLSLFGASPVMAQEQDPQTQQQATGPAAQQQVPEEWLDDFEFETGRVYYILDQGDTLQDVADRFGTTVEDLRDANTDIVEDVNDNDNDVNDDNGYSLFVGQPILIPEDAEALEQYDFNDNGFLGLGTDNDNDNDADAQTQQVGTIDPNQEADTDWEFETTDLQQLEAGEVYYIVQSGDSLQGIADRFDTTVQELEQLNAQWFEDTLYVGQPIQLPEQVFPLTPVTGEPPAEATPTPDPAAPQPTPEATPDPGAPAVQPTPQPGVDPTPAPADQVGTTPAEEDFDDDELAQFQWQTGAVYYIVAQGDTMQDIANRTGLTVQQLQQANADLDADQLRVGQPIQLPEGAVPVTGVQQPGVPVTGLDFTVTPNDFANRTFVHMNHGQIHNGYYIAQEGDNMTRIAQRMGVTLVQLLDANPQIGNPNLIFRGEGIRIPAQAERGFFEDPQRDAFGVDVGEVPWDRIPLAQPAAGPRDRRAAAAH
jgi:LysM repeat protein